MGMIFGTIYSFILCIGYFPIICAFSGPLQYSLISSQAIFMGFYQLSRLYHCFSENQIYLTKAYPKWLFIVMQIIGVLLIITAWLTDDVYKWLSSVDDGALHQLAIKFKKSRIRGRILDNVTEPLVIEMDVPVGD